MADVAPGPTRSGTGPSLEPETLTVQSTSNRLTLAYPPTEKDGETRYAAVPVPASHQVAIVVLKILGKSSTKNRKGKWGWADIDPDNWLLMVQSPGEEVGVLEKWIISPFLGGKLYITLGETNGIERIWIDMDPAYGKIDRPNKFSEAVETAKHIQSRGLLTTKFSCLTKPHIHLLRVS
ncbi:hypothetical protein B0H10DRAFT_2187436 [Mycena sp. CBHHK59/15]|nr:hypothetical protein B0H10DRAFT_2187436 [Mycena sp. CBHHK59/15]